MGEQRPYRIWFMRALYLALALSIMFLHLLPLETTPRIWAPPDVMLALTFAWAMRRPEYVPPLSIGAMYLLADLLFQRPPGLYAAVVVLGAEALRARASVNRTLPYLVEWATVAGVLIGVEVVNRTLLAVFFLPRPSLSLILIELAMTIAIYPVAVLVSHVFLNVRKAAPGETNAQGQRL